MVANTWTHTHAVERVMEASRNMPRRPVPGRLLHRRVGRAAETPRPPTTRHVRESPCPTSRGNAGCRTAVETREFAFMFSDPGLVGSTATVGVRVVNTGWHSRCHGEVRR